MTAKQIRKQINNLHIPIVTSIRSPEGEFIAYLENLLRLGRQRETGFFIIQTVRKDKKEVCIPARSVWACPVKSHLMMIGWNDRSTLKSVKPSSTCFITARGVDIEKGNRRGTV